MTIDATLIILTVISFVLGVLVCNAGLFGT